MRVLGIDYGDRRIGVAVSDPSRTVATPLPTLHKRKGKRPPYAQLVAVVEEKEIAALVVGLPLALDGSETEWCAQVRAFGDELATRVALEVHYVDERMTSVRAERAVRGVGLPKHERERKERVDAAAATLILQAWLDRAANQANDAAGAR